MEGEQIPKATMTNFLKAKLKISFSAEFSNRILILAKDYISKLTEQANDVCTKNDKKTINAEHIEAALTNFGLQSQLKDLKDMSVMIKQQNQIKQQFRQRIQSNIEKNLQEIQGEEVQPRIVSIKQNINVIQIDDYSNSQSIDYEAEIVSEQKPEPIKKKPSPRSAKSKSQKKQKPKKSESEDDDESQL